MLSSSVALDVVASPLHLAWITLEQDGPTEEVQKLGSEALKLDPNASYILDTVGWIQTTLVCLSIWKRMQAVHTQKVNIRSSKVPVSFRVRCVIDQHAPDTGRASSQIIF